MSATLLVAAITVAFWVGWSRGRVRTLGDDKPRTRSVYTASLVALWYRAGDFEKARAAAAAALADPRLMEHSAMRIREVLDAMGTPGTA